MAYTRTTWVDNSTPYINATNLNKIEQGIYDTDVATINTRTASYTLTLTDVGEVVEMNVASANNLTVPPNSSVAFPIGTMILVSQYGAGQTTIVAGTGVTLRTSSSLTTRAQYSQVTLLKRATDEWIVGGDTT